MVPVGLTPPASDNVAASSSDPFAELLPEGLKVLNGEDSQAVAVPKSAATFPGAEGFGQFDEDVEEDDVTDDMLGDNDDFDFNDITRGIEGAQDLLAGNRRLQAVDDVANLMFGSANLSL